MDTATTRRADTLAATRASSPFGSAAAGRGAAGAGFLAGGGLTWLYVKRWGMLLKRVTPGLWQLWGGDAARRAKLERAATIADWLRQP